MIFEIKCEHVIRNDAELQAVLYFHLPAKLLALPGGFVSNCKFVASQKADSSAPAGEFNRHHHVSNQERMFKKHPAHSPVLFAPTDLGHTRVKVVPEECCSFAAQAVYHVTGTATVIVVDLGARTFQEAAMVKQFQPPQKLLRTAGNE